MSGPLLYWTCCVNEPCLTSLKVALADNKLIEQPSTHYQFPQQTLHSVRSMKINWKSELALWNTNPRSRLCKYIRWDENQIRFNYEWYPQCVNTYWYTPESPNIFNPFTDIFTEQVAVFVSLKLLIILFFISSGPLSRTGRPIRKCKLVPERGYGIIVRGTGTDNSAP